MSPYLNPPHRPRGIGWDVRSTASEVPAGRVGEVSRRPATREKYLAVRLQAALRSANEQLSAISGGVALTTSIRVPKAQP